MTVWYLVELVFELGILILLTLFTLIGVILMIELIVCIIEDLWDR